MKSHSLSSHFVRTHSMGIRACEIARTPRAGLTLLELVVVCVVVGVLVALTLPAIVTVREHARQTACRNRLKQLAIGCELFHGVHERYPPGRLFDEFGVGPDSTAWSWLAQLLPHLGHSTLYEQGRIPVATLRESQVADRSVPLFRCPSDVQTADPRSDAGNMVEHDFAVGLTNYKGVSGANWGADESQELEYGELQTNWAHPGTNGSYDGLSEGDGIMFRTDYRVQRRSADVADGLTQTLMIGEALPEFDIYCSWPYTNNAYSTCAIPPNHPGSGDPADWANMLAFRSRHPGGLHFAFADGHVEFLNEDIALDVYRALATIRGAEVCPPRRP